MDMRRILLALLTISMVTGATEAAPAPIIMRSDVAAALQRFERAYAAHRPASADERQRVHRAFDEASRLYFAGKHPESLQALNELSESLVPQQAGQRPAAAALIDSLQVRISPIVAQRTRPSILRIRVARMYPVPIDSPLELRLRIRSDAPDPRTVLDEAIRIEPSGPPVALAVKQPESAMGRYVVELVGPDGTAHPAGRWSVVETPLDVLRINNDRRLSEQRPTTPEMVHALVAIRARNTLVSDRIDENSPAQFLADPVLLSRAVQSEVEWFVMGKDPFAAREGDYWRAILAGQMQFPARVYAPPQVEQGQPLPVLIALHGAGGDESAFMESFGNGQIKRLADEHGLIVVAPNTLWVMRNLASFDAILETLACSYAIDKSRVYVLGHALGAGAAIQMASGRADRIAKLVLFSGAGDGALANVERLPSTLLISGELDPVFTPFHANDAGDEARRKRLPVELRVIEDAGHTLVVHDQLPEAVKWLMGK